MAYGSKGEPKKCDHKKRHCDKEFCNFEEKFKIRVRCKVECIPIKDHKDYGYDEDDEEEEYDDEEYDEDDGYYEEKYEDGYKAREKNPCGKKYMYNFNKIKDRKDWK